jgi:hypothetical protein
MIKLQLLLRHPSPEAELDPALRDALAAHGMAVTATGRASLSAEVSPSDFEHWFGPLPALQWGFAPNASAAPALPVPPDLSPAVSLITIAPQHVHMQQSL